MKTTSVRSSSFSTKLLPRASSGVAAQVTVNAAVAVAPMLGLHTAPLPRWLAVAIALAAFVVRAGRQRLAGVINAVGSSTPMADFFAAVAAVTGFSGRLVQADDEWLLDHDVHFWMGPRSLPLWLPATGVGFATRSNAAFLAAGGSLRPLRETIARALADEQRVGGDRDRRSGLTPEVEADLVAESAGRSRARPATP